MRSPADDVADYLAESTQIGSRGGNGRWAISVGGEPDKPDDVVTLYDTTGLGPDTDELDIERPSFQVRVRSRSYGSAYEIQRKVRMLLTLTEPIDTESSTFLTIEATSEILSLGRDDQDRYALVANFNTIRTEKE